MFKALHERAIVAADQYRKAEYELLELFQQIEECRGYRELGYTSMFLYATGALKLSDNAAYSLINVGRKSREIPELGESVRTGEITLSNARRIVPVLTPENQDEWIEKAKSLSKHQLEREVARIIPNEEKREQIRPIDGERAQMTVAISEELHEKLRRIQDLESQRTGQAVSLEQALVAMAENYLHYKDPVRKAERARPPKLGPGQVPGIRVALPAAIEHEITKRDQAQCTAIVNGKRCTNRRWLEVHHLEPVSEGGTNDLANLTTLCFAHHRTRHAS